MRYRPGIDAAARPEFNNILFLPGHNPEQQRLHISFAQPHVVVGRQATFSNIPYQKLIR